MITPLNNSSEARPKFPKRAVVTAGMPNGNKELHIGHISTFIWADTIARFLKDVLGKDNVIFTSTTDSYGSMVTEKLKAMQANGFKGTEYDVVEKYHSANKKTLQEYDIGLDTFFSNCLEPLRSEHKKLSDEIFETLLKNGAVTKAKSLSFYDEELKTFLNGRQVVGKCPISNCKSEEAYADECALGHPYMPSELIDPVSILSKTRPVLKESTNYYFDLPNHRDFLVTLANEWEQRSDIRPAMVKELREFLKKPSIYIHKGETLEFDTLEEREAAAAQLTANGTRFRNGKTLTPFRMTGNSPWGVAVPKENATFYVWAESSWAHMSSTKVLLKSKNSKLDWKDFWCDKNSATFQVIGEDNIYFYTLARPALFKALNWGINTSTIISNKHTLLSGAKAASSGIKKAPTAADLLTKYTPEQIKMYCLWQNVPNTTVEFKSKAFFPEMFGNEEDPFLQGGNILTNIFNRIIRSVFYSLAKYLENKMPNGKVSEDVFKESMETMLSFERNVMNFDLNKNINLLDAYLRNANKTWARVTNECMKNEDMAAIKQIVVDTLFIIKSGIMMLHCITPSGCELVADKLNLNHAIFNWKNIAEPIYGFAKNKDFTASELEPKFDFFRKHPSQFA